jgi:hypothetical protein
MLHSPTLWRAALLAMIVSLFPAPAHGANPAQQQQQMMQRMMQQAQQQQQQMMRMIQQMQQQAQRQMQQQQQMMRNQARASQIVNRTMSRQAQMMARAARNMPRPVLQNVVAEYGFVIADDGLIRSMTVLAPELDEKGKPKTLTADEKLKLRGDTPEERKVAGYKAGVEDLMPGDEVIVTLSRYLPAKHSSPGEKEKEDKDKDAKKEAKKEKDADREKAKSDDTEKSKKDMEGDETDDAHKLARLKDWRAKGKLHGVVVETDMASSRRMVIAIQGQQVVMQSPLNRNNNNNNNNKANAKPQQTSIDPSVMQGTLVVIVKRGQGGAGGTSGNTGFGFGK